MTFKKNVNPKMLGMFYSLLYFRVRIAIVIAFLMVSRVSGSKQKPQPTVQAQNQSVAESPPFSFDVQQEQSAANELLLRARMCRNLQEDAAVEHDNHALRFETPVSWDLVAP